MNDLDQFRIEIEPVLVRQAHNLFAALVSIVLAHDDITDTVGKGRPAAHLVAAFSEALADARALISDIENEFVATPGDPPQ